MPSAFFFDSMVHIRQVGDRIEVVARRGSQESKSSEGGSWLTTRSGSPVSPEGEGGSSASAELTGPPLPALPQAPPARETTTGSAQTDSARSRSERVRPAPPTEALRRDDCGVTGERLWADTPGFPRGIYQRWPYMTPKELASAQKANQGTTVQPAADSTATRDSGETEWSVVHSCCSPKHTGDHAIFLPIPDSKIRERLQNSGRLQGVDPADALSERYLNPDLWNAVQDARLENRLDFNTVPEELILRPGESNFSVCVDCEKSAAGSPVVSAPWFRPEALGYKVFRHVDCKTASDAGGSLSDGVKSLTDISD